MLKPCRMCGAIARGLLAAALLAGNVGAVEAAKAMYYHDWRVLGPFPNEENKGFATPYPPERAVDLDGWFTGLNNATIRWRRLAGATDSPWRPGPLNLRDLFGVKASACAYAFTTIHSERGRRVSLLLGADGGLIAWVNGKQVLSKEGSGIARPDEHALDLTLQKGENTVLLKLCRAGEGPWACYARLDAPPDEKARRHTLENESARFLFDYLGRLVEVFNKETGTACTAPAGEAEPAPAFIVDAYSRNRAIYLNDPLLREGGGFSAADPRLLFSTTPSGDLLRLTVEPWRTPEATLSDAAGGGKTLTFRYLLAGGIELTTTATLPATGGVSEWQAKVDNRGDVKPLHQLRVYRVLFPLLGNLCVGGRPEENFLARTYVQGELIPNPSQYGFHRPGSPGAHTNVLTYPGWASMPWMDLYQSGLVPPASGLASPASGLVPPASGLASPASGLVPPASGLASPASGLVPPASGLYFASYDPRFQQVDIEAVPDAARKTLAMGMRTLAFLEPGEAWQSQTFVVATHAGDWHWAADRYRADSARWLKKRDVPDWVADSDGWFGSGGPNYRYSDFPAMLEEARWLGLDYLQCWSEMIENVGPNKSRKAYYCFFLPDPERGGEKEMAQGVRKVREMGGHIGFYSNFWTWDADTLNCLQQWKDQIPPDVKIPDWAEFRKYMSVFPDGHMEAGDYYDGYSGSCPGAQGWRDYLKFWIVDKYVKQYGVDAWYLDSFPVTMFGAARVCFSPYHGPGRPHGVGPSLLEFVKTLREASEGTVKLAITSESINDVFMQYNSHALGLELIQGLTEHQKPEIYTYTFPHHAIFSGSCNGAGSGLKYYYKDLEKPTRAETFDRVFLMGYRFDILGYKLRKDDPNMLYLRDLIALRQRIKGDLYLSSFKDEIGLGPLPANVYAKVFRHDEGKSVTVVFLDRRAKKDAMALTLRPASLADRLAVGFSSAPGGTGSGWPPAVQVGGLGKATLFALGGKSVALEVKAAADGWLEVAVPAREAAPAAIVFSP